jgi:hypothetical protein
VKNEHGISDINQLTWVKDLIDKGRSEIG